MSKIITTVEKNVAAEIKMLKDLIQMTEQNLKDMISWGEAEHEELEEMRNEIANYKADLARIEQPAPVAVQVEDKPATKIVNILELKVGDIVHAHGARFHIYQAEAKRDMVLNKEGNGFVAEGQLLMHAYGKWIDGRIEQGYFGPTKDWKFQGNENVSHKVEV